MLELLERPYFDDEDLSDADNAGNQEGEQNLTEPTVEVVEPEA
jgi:hypothetical protein